MTRTDTAHSGSDPRTLPPAILELVRDGRRIRGRLGRWAEREVCYGDYLQVLVDEIREAAALEPTS